MGSRMRVAVIGATAAAVATLALVPSGASAEREQARPAAPATASSTAPDLLDVGAPATTTGATRRAGPAREAEVDTALLRPGTARTVSIDVPDGTLEVGLEPAASGAPGWSAWTGDVAGDPHGAATIVRNGDDVAGLISTTTGSYRIRTTAPGEQVVQDITRTFPEHRADSVAPPATFDLGVSPDQLEAPGTAADVPTYPVIDVLVAYTPAALTDAGTVQAMDAEIALAVSVTNAAYEDSGVAGRLRLAGTSALTEDFDLSDESLKQLRFVDDGHADGLHALRNRTGADLVSVLVHDPTGCGLGYLLLSIQASTTYASPFGFSTVDYSCAVDNYSFAHELGHNMGLDHDRGAPPPITPLFPYGVGYVDVAHEWRTIMAYDNQCAAQDPVVHCERLGRFSNPDQTYEGAPLGRPASGPDPADERLALNNAHAYVASYRAKPAPFTSWSRFVAQQSRDFLGRNPTSSESTAAVNALNTGAKTPQAYVNELLTGWTGSSYGSVARLYFAYFVRPPDQGGLDFWVKRHQAGMKLSAISSNFAASNEFKTKYGSLTDRAFVEKIYTNLFERTGDPSGLAYWTGKLDQKVKTRGQVMIGFSESSEFKRVRAEEIRVVLLYRSMLQRTPTATEYASQLARLQGGTTVPRLILELLDSTAYGSRITK